MTTEEMLFAMQTGMDLVKECKDKGYDMVALGEMGIGNTTTSSAVCAALLSVPAKAVTGRGAGLCDEKLAHKMDVIQAAIEKYGLYEKEPLTVLETVGGYDIAAMAGACIGGACYGMPIVLDGFISMTAAYVACRINDAVKEYLIPSHSSKEKAVTYLCKEMELSPVVDANMALGEGSGAMMMIALLKMAAAVLYESYSFENAKIEQYERFEGNT